MTEHMSCDHIKIYSILITIYIIMLVVNITIKREFHLLMLAHFLPNLLHDIAFLIHLY